MHGNRLQSIWAYLYRCLCLLLCLPLTATAVDLSPSALASQAPNVLSKAQKQTLSSLLVGSWKRVGYLAFDKKKRGYLDVPVPKDPIDATVETWLFREDGSFRHQVDERLWFSGKAEPTAAWGTLTIPTSAKVNAKDVKGYFVIRCSDVTVSTLERRKEEFFLARFTDRGRNLVIYYQGPNLKPRAATFWQGHVFERRPYGER